MTQQTEDDIRRRLEQLSGEMHGQFAELEAEGFALGQIGLCAVETALSRLHRRARLDETLDWCRLVARAMNRQVELREAFLDELGRRAIN